MLLTYSRWPFLKVVVKFQNAALSHRLFELHTGESRACAG